MIPFVMVTRFGAKKPCIGARMLLLEATPILGHARTGEVVYILRVVQMGAAQSLAVCVPSLLWQLVVVCADSLTSFVQKLLLVVPEETKAD